MSEKVDMDDQAGNIIPIMEKSERRTSGAWKMDEQTKELVAISASIAGHCQPCFKHHFKKARELGIGLDDIREVAGLASRISGAGDQRMVEFVDETMKEKDKGE